MPARPNWLRTALLAAGGLLGWLFYFAIATAIIIAEPLRNSPQLAWQYDFHVYLGGARDLVEGTLYRVPLTLDSFPLPVSVFNLPPVSALAALPWAPFDPIAGGQVWLALMTVCIGVGCVLAAGAFGLRPAVLYGGIGAFLYLLSPWFTADMLLGNNNGIVFPLVAGFILMHLRGRHRASGLLLGIAVAFKPWPLAFIPLLLRERSLREVYWATGVLVVQGVLFLGWLGPDVLPLMVGAIMSPVPIEPGVPVLGWTYLRHYIGLPAWIGPLLGLLLLAIPVRGRMGLGLGLFAGLTLMVPNLWQHYLPVVVLGVALLLVPLASRVWDAFGTRRCTPAAS